LAENTVIMWGSINTCPKAVMNSRPIHEPKIYIGVDDLICLLSVLSSWYPYEPNLPHQTKGWVRRWGGGLRLTQGSSSDVWAGRNPKDAQTQGWLLKRDTTHMRVLMTAMTYNNPETILIHTSQWANICL
jgi:hypothetical protein